MNQTLSDNIICNDCIYNQYKFVRNNDLEFINHFTKSVPDKIRDIDNETNLRNSQFLNKYNNCLQGVITRGNNSSQKCDDYMFKSCKNFTSHDNYKFFSISHRIFNNNTKRK